MVQGPLLVVQALGPHLASPDDFRNDRERHSLPFGFGVEEVGWGEDLGLTCIVITYLGTVV
jgi:hypothetical protein